jgi:glycosyltransferase involved in cell wall biosynthesis
MLGGIPAALGGGGLELQVARTAAALSRRGHEVVRVEHADAADSFDVLHAFGSEPSTWHVLQHWTRNQVPLVVTPILVVSPGRQERALRLAARVPGLMTGSRMRSQVLRGAAAVIAGTEYERGLVTGFFSADPETTFVIGNGADPEAPGDLPEGVPDGPFALSLGSVTPRKRIAETARAMAGRMPLVVAGGFGGSAEELPAWKRTVSDTGTLWLGHVEEPSAVAALQSSALALVHLSAAEVQSLAVVETLARGTPAILSDIPSHRELGGRYPAHVRLVKSPEEVPAAIESLREAPPGPPPPIPTWDDVAGELERIYARVAGGG